MPVLAQRLEMEQFAAALESEELATLLPLAPYQLAD